MTLVSAGGGAGAIGRCFRFPGASRSFLEAAIPYSPAAMRDYLGGSPSGPAASLETARQLAARAFDRATRLAAADDLTGQLAAVACTAALPTDRARRGDDRAHVVLQTEDAVTCRSIRFEAGEHDRDSAESLLDSVVLATLGELVELPPLGRLQELPGASLRTTREPR